MPELQEVFNRITEHKKERKKVSDIYKQALANSKAFQDAKDEWERVKAKKIQIEASIRAECAGEIEQMEKLKEHLDADTELLNDLALTSLMKGQTVEVKDEHDTTYEPVFSVRFKKSGSSAPTPAQE